MRTASWFPLAREYSMNIVSLTSEFRWDQVFPNYYGCLQKHYRDRFFKCYCPLFCMKKLSKSEAEKEIKEFFKNIQNKSPKEIKQIKRLAMKHNIKLGSLRKKFCKKCFSPKLKIKGIKNKIKTVECRNCRQISRWRVKNWKSRTS